MLSPRHASFAGPILFGSTCAFIAAVPAFAIWNGPSGNLFLMLMSAATATMTASLASVPDLRHVRYLLRKLAFIIVLPALWLLLQMAPLPLDLANPIWSSAAKALALPIWGNISTDLGKTVLCLAAYLALLAIFTMTIVAAKERAHAEKTLYALGAAAALCAAILLIVKFYMSASATPPLIWPLRTASAIGMIANVAIILRAIERYKSRSTSDHDRFVAMITGCAWSLAGVLICAAALGVDGNLNFILLSFLASAFVVAIVAIRWSGLSMWVSSPMLAILVFAAAARTYTEYGRGGRAFPLLGNTDKGMEELYATTQRMLSGTSWFGNGAGTFTALAPAYQDFDATPAAFAPSAISGLVIEWGVGGMILIFVLAAWLFLFLARGAFQRGRDSFFAAAAAATVLVITFGSFVDSSASSMSIKILAAVMIGLGVSQTESESHWSRGRAGRASR
jgi:hypothetical protein